MAWRPSRVSEVQRNRRSRLRGAVVTCVLIAACRPASGVAQEPSPVVVAQPGIGTVPETLELTGTVTSARVAELSPRVSGLVARVLVDAGSRGDLLLELDDALARLELERVTAELDEGRIRLAEAKRLRDEVVRLVADHHVPKSQADTVEAELEIAAAAVTRLNIQRRQQAEIVARHRLLAPFPGIVSRKLSETGEWVATGTPVLELVATDELRVDVQAPQQRQSDLAAGTVATIRADGLPGVEFQGTVSAVVPVKDPASRTFLVRIAVPKTGGQLTPGMSANVTFTLERALGAMTVPRDAIIRQPDGSALVWVVVEQGESSIAAPRRVELGRAIGDFIEVRSGLDSEARVVVRGNELLREGRPVNVLSR
jgi:RND family efflux transporter MFP subunit